MASYKDWNQALVTYFTSGISRGTKVYLSVDDELLERLGSKLNQKFTDGSWSNDFRIAVKQKVIVEGYVNLSKLRPVGADGLPQGVAFLGAMVLAANEMADEEEISEENYLKRLRAVLGLPTIDKGRPPGMKSGSDAEEPLWLYWNRWLMANGFMASAYRGRGGRTTYINYPISQSLLRRADKNRLMQLFSDKQWTAPWDAMSLFTNVRREAPRLPKHLKELLTNNRERYEAVAEAIHEIYEQWQDNSFSVKQRTEVQSWSRHIFVGLYRTEDPFLGEVNYYLYPRQIRGRQLELVQVQYEDNNVYQLRNERPGWYFPLECLLKIKELECGAKYPITFPPELDSLVLPSRNFWILIPDPDDPDTGAYATWGQPSLGTQFILLCKKELLSDINRLRDERLIDWYGEAQPIFDNSNWVELHHCMVVSQAWDGVFIKNPELKDALQPSTRLSISISGGLRVPKQNVWLQGYSLQVTVFGFYTTAKLKITQVSDNSQILDKLQNTNTPTLVDFPSSGDFLIQATCGNESTERFVRIVDWSSLSIEKLKCHEVIPVGCGHHICGTVIKPITEPIEI
ncbi:hypothetical protein [Scytonema sp. NUACC26]|uniref:hypothetical protein n=1 Tax=Scytonema sp. NUACC26 TaxID=3140176 RepID=UPI0034DC1F1D